jgi:hypothetical protein
MGKSTVRIGSFEIYDAQLSKPDAKGGDTLRIPCKSDAGLCMQLDGWDEKTSIPAILDGRHSILYKQHYDKDEDAWIMRLE